MIQFVKDKSHWFIGSLILIAVIWADGYVVHFYENAWWEVPFVLTSGIAGIVGLAIALSKLDAKTYSGDDDDHY